MQHGHNDGTWHEVEEVTADAAHEDPERGWFRGRIFKCKSCDEQFRVAEPDQSAVQDPLA